MNSAAQNPHPLSRAAAGSGLSRRHRAEWRFKFYGRAALVLSFAFLGLLLYTIAEKGLPAFTETAIVLDVPVPADANADYDEVLRGVLRARFPEATERKDRMRLYRLLSRRAPIELRDAVRENPALMGMTTQLTFTAASSVDMYRKGAIDRSLPEDRRSFKDNQIKWTDQLAQEGRIKPRFNRNFFENGDSRDPESAGFLGSIVGSLYIIAVCLLIAFPVGVGAAIYLEEFAPKNAFTDAIEVNINNLAAVPSIVFGLLGLAVFLQFFGLPRGSALAGGCTLALLVLPTLVITTRNALKSVPPSIRTAAMGLGASPVQVLFHHTLPLAMPGVMTGTILAIARALGETAPLLMIGMVAFVADVPTTPLDPATAMPVQIYLWSDSPEMGFTERTSAGILVLLAFLITCNAVAAFLRKKYERKW